MRLSSYEVPVAVSMIELARITLQPFQEFTCYWTAFNNIYTVIADRNGCRASLKKHQDGTLQIRQIGNVKIVRVEIPREREQIDLAFAQFSSELKHNLIVHSNTRFFVYRIPKWRGRDIEYDDFGQRLNGVLNVGHTVSPKYPVWSPIDT